MDSAYLNLCKMNLCSASLHGISQLIWLEYKLFGPTCECRQPCGTIAENGTLAVGHQVASENTCSDEKGDYWWIRISPSKNKKQNLPKTASKRCISKVSIIWQEYMCMHTYTDRHINSYIYKHIYHAQIQPEYSILRQNLVSWRLRILNCFKMFTVWVRNVRSSCIL